MNAISKMTTWGDSHHLGWFDFFRTLLGIFLIYKGIEFGRHPQEITELTQGAGLSLFSFFFIQYIIIGHTMGGLMIALGFKTRWAAVVQIPILLGAIILNLTPARSLEIYSSLLPGILVFLLLIAFTVYGSGPYSVDEFFRKHDN